MMKKVTDFKPLWQITVTLC